MVDLHKASDQKLDSSMREIKANIKGINVHLDDLETWKKGVDSQLRHLASAIPRASGSLPGKTKENPRGHVAAIDLRSGKKLSDATRKFKETQSTAMLDGTHSVPDGTTV